MTNLRKVIFLEYKFGDYNTETLYSSGANEVVAWMDRLNDQRLRQLRNWGIKLTISFSAFSDNICPFDPKSGAILKQALRKAMAYHPDGIVLDHFRFRGRWEQSEEKLKYVLTHEPCQHCRRTNKGRLLAKIASEIKQLVSKEIELGYYAVPVEYGQFPQFGQDHKLLTKVFDYSSPMLYHRMLGKSVQYIHSFIRYLADLNNKPVVPAIAIKDMPDDLPDQINESILRQEYEQATLPPSVGVCWFSWDGAIEKHKTGIIAKIWK